MAYQHRLADAFYYRYEYDAENKLTEAYTSRDAVYWEREAAYTYYKHGLLDCTRVGQQGVQGIDSTYTLRGWLKGINSSAACENSLAMGRDRMIGGSRRFAARDKLGMGLLCYRTDYEEIGKPVPFRGAGFAAVLANTYSLLRNGNIVGISLNVRKLIASLDVIDKILFSVIIENLKNYANLCPMKYAESKEKFIETWGHLGSQWGINKSIAQVQALLLIAPSPLTTDAVMEELKISRGNANMSIRQLLDWGIIYKKSVPGDRKEYFVAEKDVWKWALKIGSVRKQRELNPVLDLLKEIATEKGTAKTDEEKEFARQIKDLHVFTEQIGGLADKLFSSPKGELLFKMLKMFA